MRILFVTTNKYLPQTFGGIEANLDTLSRGLITRGHDVRIVANLARGDFIWLKNRLLKKTLGAAHIRERFGPYFVYRDYDLPSVVDTLWGTFRPDIFVIHCGICEYFTHCGICENVTRIPEV